MKNDSNNMGPFKYLALLLLVLFVLSILLACLGYFIDAVKQQDMKTILIYAIVITAVLLSYSIYTSLLDKQKERSSIVTAMKVHIKRLGLYTVLQLSVVPGVIIGLFLLLGILEEGFSPALLISLVICVLLVITGLISEKKADSAGETLRKNSSDLATGIQEMRSALDLTKQANDLLIKNKNETILREFLSHQAENFGPGRPVSVDGQSVHINTDGFAAYMNLHPELRFFKEEKIISLSEKDPVIRLYEDGKLQHEYCLQTEGDEDFTGRYFHMVILVYETGSPKIPVCQIDGFITDTPEEREFGSDVIGYRMEVCILDAGGAEAKKRREMIRGKDLDSKALKYPNRTTPSNVRLIGICPECGRSFAFHGTAVYMLQYDAAYSDDGLDVCSITEPKIDAETWSYEADGKTFRYFNSFCCPFCGTPYIDYNSHRDMKRFGVSACVHLGRHLYSSDEPHHSASDILENKTGSGPFPASPSSSNETEPAREKD